MSTTIYKPISSDDLRLRAQQDGSEQRVEVNQRMLIDKMLARYSSDFVFCRELIQNSDDAQATLFHFEITCDTPTTASNIMSDFHNSTIAEIRTVNNGLTFNQTDWKRIAAIAEGNTNVDSVGQFGVGFFFCFFIDGSAHYHIWR
jgi:HSP90 family molecular chaperone